MGGGSAKVGNFTDEGRWNGYELVDDLTLWSERDDAFMRRALELAQRAAAAGEILGEGWNCPVAAHDPTAHAEIRAMRAASLRAQNYRLTGATLYVTLEPCVMCAGAIVAARVERLVFGARDIRFGGVRSVFALADSELQNHRVKVEEGLRGVEAAELLREFFAGRRS
jgi:tRNA(adenine34) deaminase